MHPNNQSVISDGKISVDAKKLNPGSQTKTRSHAETGSDNYSQYGSVLVQDSPSVKFDGVPQGPPYQFKVKTTEENIIIEKITETHDEVSRAMSFPIRENLDPNKIPVAFRFRVRVDDKYVTLLRKVFYKEDIERLRAKRNARRIKEENEKEVGEYETTAEELQDFNNVHENKRKLEHERKNRLSPYVKRHSLDVEPNAEKLNETSETQFVIPVNNTEELSEDQIKGDEATKFKQLRHEEAPAFSQQLSHEEAPAFSQQLSQEDALAFSQMRHTNERDNVGERLREKSNNIANAKRSKSTRKQNYGTIKQNEDTDGIDREIDIELSRQWSNPNLFNPEKSLSQKSQTGIQKSETFTITVSDAGTVADGREAELEAYSETYSVPVGLPSVEHRQMQNSSAENNSSRSSLSTVLKQNFNPIHISKKPTEKNTSSGKKSTAKKVLKETKKKGKGKKKEKEKSKGGKKKKSLKH